MGADKLLRVLLFHRWTIAILCLSAVFNVVALTYVVPETYEATALVLVRPGQETRLGGGETPKSILDFPVGMNPPNEAPSKTFTELIKSRSSVEQIVRNLGLDKLKRKTEASYLKELWASFKDEATELAGQAWDLLRYGRILPQDPLNKAVREVQKRIAVTPTKNSYVFAISCKWKDAALARDIVMESAAVFVELVADIGRREAKGGRELIEQRLQATETELAEARGALRVFKEQNKSVLFTEEATERIKMIAGLEESLEKTQAELAGLLRQYTPLHPKVRRAQAEGASLLASIAQLKDEQKVLPAKEAELMQLKLRVKADETIYDLIRKEYEEARIREAKRTSEIRVVSPAMLPASPVKPIKIYYAGTALLMALFVGIGFAAVAESVNSTLRDVDGVERVLGLPVLGCIPRMERR